MEILQRDARDSGRDLAPLRKVEDAIPIDSTGLSVEEVFRNILDIVRQDRAGSAEEGCISCR
jgi:cytidylate kinase